MEILIGDKIKLITGYSQKSSQVKWFSERGYKYEVDKDNNVWTTDQWLNHADKYQTVSNDDGFNLSGVA